MTTPYLDDEEMDPSDEDLAAIEWDDGEEILSLEDLEELEEEKSVSHRVLTFNEGDDGEGYFDGAYFDE